MKLEWNDKVVTITRTDGLFLEDLIEKGSIEAFDKNLESASVVKVVCVDKDKFELHFDIVVDKVVLNGIAHEKNLTARAPAPEMLEAITAEFSEAENEYIPEISCILSKKNGYITVTSSEDVEAVISKFFKETYPDVPFEETAVAVKKTESFVNLEKIDKGLVYSVSIYSGETLVTEDVFYGTPLYYFSSVESLKRDIKEYQLPIISEETIMKDLIGEKSTVLKKNFGILPEHVTDPELMPIFKSVVNLYCIKDLMSLGFLNGTFNMSDSEGGATSVVSNSITLGKLSVSGIDQSGSGGGSNPLNYSGKLEFGYRIIDELIAKQEEILYNSLFKETCGIVKKGGGCSWTRRR